MKAVVYKRYGPPDVLELTEIEKPKPLPDEVLVKVYSTTVTAGDWRMRKADPFLARLFNGLLKPGKVQILGFELAGIIEEVGTEVARYRTGDAVFASCGMKFGAYAEYKCLKQDGLIALKPSNMSFDEAATVPIGGTTALGFLKKVDLKPGQRIVVYGASGSVGTFAVQIAKSFGAKVTGICGTNNMKLVESLGVEQVFDYSTEAFRMLREQYDVVFDAVGKMSGSIRKNLKAPNGKFISVSGSPKATVSDMTVLKELIESGKLKTVIDRTYNLEQVRDAHTYVERFHKKGNVVLKVHEDLF